MHLIGHVDRPAKQVHWWEKTLDGLQWLPNGKKLSFIYLDRLYVVAAE
jgi:hypothetical protein